MKAKKLLFFLHQLQRLTAGPSSPYLLYTQLSCLFQILFEYEKLAEIPIGNFLPWQRLKPAFGGKVNIQYILLTFPSLKFDFYLFV